MTLKTDVFVADGALEWYRSAADRLLYEISDWRWEPSPIDFCIPAVVTLSRVIGIRWQDFPRLVVGSPGVGGRFKALILRLIRDEQFRALAAAAEIPIDEAGWMDNVFDRSLSIAKRDAKFIAQFNAAFRAATRKGGF